MRSSSGTPRVLVFAGGEFEPSDLDALGGDLASAVCICVDSGLVHCLAAGLHPHVLVGDMDSVPLDALDDEAITAVPRLLYSSDKNASDLELALLLLTGEVDTDHLVGTRADGRDGTLSLQAVQNIVDVIDKPDEVVIAGLSGGRTDHLLFNWLLAAKRVWPFRLRMLDATSDAMLVHPACPARFIEQAGRTVSLIPMGRVAGVTTEGLRYALRDATLDPGTTLGLSNVTTDGPLTVTVREGRLLVIRVRSSLE